MEMLAYSGYDAYMNRLSTAKRVQVTSALVEGVSINATCRMTGVAKHTVLSCLRTWEVRQLLTTMSTFGVSRFAGCRLTRFGRSVKRKLRMSHLSRKPQAGDVWTWTAIDADTKLIISYLVGGRSTGWAMDFMQDCRDRIATNPQITTDAHKPYLKAVEEAYGGDVNYAQLHEVYGYDQHDTRYSPATCIGCDMKTVSGVPDLNTSLSVKT